jgi:hypothetical protein
MSITKVNADVLDLTDGYAFTGDVSGAGKIIQVVSTLYATNATTTTTMTSAPPTITEGGEFFTVAITPTDVLNTLIIHANCNLSASTGAYPRVQMALYQDAVTNALASNSDSRNSTNMHSSQSLIYSMAAGTLSEITFRVRCGSSNAGTFTVNPSNHAAAVSGIVVTEVSV